MARPRKGGERYPSGDLKPKRPVWMPPPDPPEMNKRPSWCEGPLKKWEHMRFWGEGDWREERARYEHEQLADCQKPGYPDEIRVWRAKP